MELRVRCAVVLLISCVSVVAVTRKTEQLQMFASREFLDAQAKAGLKPANLGFARSEDDQLILAGKPGQGLAFCGVPKVATTLWKILLQRLDGNKAWFEMAQTPHYNIVPKFGHGLGFGLRRVRYNESVDPTNTSAVALLDDPAWTKIVFARDPLTRLLSGYIDKCTKAPLWERVHSCFGPWIADERVPSFEEFANHLVTSVKNRDELGLHFRPQASFCGLDVPGNAAKFHVFADMNQLEEKTVAILDSLGLGHLAENWPSGNMFDRGNAKGHASNAGEQLRKYYTPELCMKALDFYKDSYTMFQAVDAPPFKSWKDQCSLLQGSSHLLTERKITNEASTWAGQLVSFPLQMMAKSVKMLPNMIMARVVSQKASSIQSGSHLRLGHSDFLCTVNSSDFVSMG